MAKKDAKAEQCVECKRDLGDEAKISPVRVTDVADASKTEPWCPRCFAFKRAPMEPQRFHAPSMGPVACSSCGETLAVGGRNCGNCGSRFVIDLPPVGAKVA